MKNYILTILLAVALLAGYQTIAAEDSTPKTEKQTTNTEKQTNKTEKQTSNTEKLATKTYKQTSNTDKQATKTEKQTSNTEKLVTKTDKQTTNTEKRQTVVLTCDLHCQGCCDKVMKNIAFEKGVKDLVCDLKTKTVTVTFDPRKTDIETLLAAFERIGKPAQVKK